MDTLHSIGPCLPLTELTASLPAVLDDVLSRLTATPRSVSDVEIVNTAVALVMECVNVELARYSARFSSRALTASVPAEILAVIFQFLGFGDRITATHVCKRWRAVCLSDASLWSDIRTVDKTSGTLTPQLARVPYGIRFDLAVDVVQDRDGEVLHALETRLRDIRGLYLRFVGAPSPRSVRRIRDVLSQPVPNLQRLRIICGDTINWMGSSDCPLFPNGAPQLASIKYSGFSDRVSTWALAGQVRHLVMSTHGFFDRTSLAELFEVFPNVEHFGLELTDVDDPFFHGSPAPLLPPASLIEFALTTTRRPSDLRPLLAQLDYSRIPVFGVCLKAGTSDVDSRLHLEAIASSVQRTVECATMTLHAKLADGDVVDINLITAGVGQHIHLLRVRCHVVEISRLLGSSLRSLRISEVLLLQDMHSPWEFPQLESLSIILLLPNQQADLGPWSLFLVYYTGRTPLLICPRLRALTIEREETRGGERIAPEMIRLFLEQHVVGVGRVTIYLRDVELVTNNGEQLAALFALVTDVVELRAEPEPRQRPFRHLLSMDPDFD